MSPHCLLAQRSLSLPQFNTGSNSSALSKYTALLHFTVLLLSHAFSPPISSTFSLSYDTFTSVNTVL
uniref:Uncharacterized protein n=1 Tax=Anguilla anguilla TaxID=7936 RepID=A0A0E9VZJ2_ANGAN